MDGVGSDSAPSSSVCVHVHTYTLHEVFFREGCQHLWERILEKMVSDDISVSSESRSAGGNGWLRVRQCGDTPVHTTEALLPQGETVLDKFT